MNRTLHIAGSCVVALVLVTALLVTQCVRDKLIAEIEAARWLGPTEAFTQESPG